MKRSFQKRYNDSINLIGHLILTKPKPVIGLLAKHGITFKGIPHGNQLIDEVVELLKSNTQKFEDDLSKLLMIHIQFKGKEMLALERGDFSSYDDGAQDEDEFWGAIAKGVVGGIGSIFKKKRNKGRGGNSASLIASQAAARRRAAAQAAQMKRDLQMQLQRIRKEAAERRRREAETRRREEAARRRREAEAKKEADKKAVAAKKEAEKKEKRLYITAGVILGTLLIGGAIFASGRSRTPQIPYMPAQTIPNR
ncbi:hypothetical protein [Aquimarina aggregata]|uniref:hypothetical protein n=1 Tax=Aquimarina aggregata TaxID=1642818 RepID=UPI0024938573|nr:hypothetical protein [Aquimarina aggregata]